MIRAQMLEDLLTHFDNAELAKLCSEFGVDSNELEGKSKRKKIRSLLRRTQGQELVSDLIEMMVSLKPDLVSSHPDEDVLKWIDRVVPEKLVPADELPTMKWSGDRSPGDDDPDGLVPKAAAATEEIPTMTWPEELEKPGKIADPGGSDGYQQPGSDSEGQWFVGREEERRQLAAQLTQISSCAVAGIPGIGKSALLHYLAELHHFPPEHRVLFANPELRDERYHTVAGLNNGALAGWYSRLLDAPPPVAPTLADFRRQLRTLHEAGFRPILCLDGFEQLMALPSVYDDALFAGWYEIARSGHLTFLVTAERPLAELMEDRGVSSLFAGLFYQLELGLLSETAAARLLVEEVAAHGAVLPRAWLEPMLSLCGRHPLYLKMAANIASDVLSADHPEYALVSERLRQQASASWQLLWQCLSERQKSLLTGAIPDDPPLVMVRLYQRLADRGLLLNEDGRFQLFSQGFADWLTQGR